jgi:hypothetical protein
MTSARPEDVESEKGRRDGNQRNTSDLKRNRALARRSLKSGPFLIALRVSAWFLPDHLAKPTPSRRASRHCSETFAPMGFRSILVKLSHRRQ